MPVTGFRGLGVPGRALLAAAALGIGLSAQPSRAAEAPATFADLVETALPAVVNISTTQRATPAQAAPDPSDLPPGSPFEEFFRRYREAPGESAPQQPQHAMGSGFIIDPSGLVVTNNHVIEGAEKVQIILQDERVLEAEIVGADGATDLALLRVRSESPLPAVRWGDSRGLRVGDWLVAIGNPFGLGGTVTSGILSARARDIQQGPYDEYLQTDAAINRGNSGGPLFNMRGEVIGINTAIFSPTGGSVGIGFAVPADLARPVIEQIQEFGRPRRGWLGVQVQPVTPDIAESLSLASPHGALVTNVTPGGPAERSGLRQGDVVVSFDGKPIREMRELPRNVAASPIGREVAVEVVRDGGRQNLRVVLGDLDEAQRVAAVAPSPAQEPAPDSAERTLGLALSQLDTGTREAFDVPADVDGVVVTEAEGNSPAADKGIAAGDVIVEVQQERVVRPEDVARRVEEARRSGRGSVLMLLNRGGDLRYVPVPVEGGRGGG
ncbi:DegQ family serine endoprotease [Arenibaculum pallidiluteum]|uniref:DegQ family serine endoprotease n=1 Tax=Arenibaculum pallidiluteum TaxID=2812559 RepID=UPI001A963FFA|nr:DegQ family serine endoprotease [Arenibaculum pallidiluteum]